jgi:cold-inducible RNA-binding protein
MSNKLYVGNLEYSVTGSDLQALFQPKAKVIECKVIEGKGFAFVTFEDEQSANAVKEEFNGYDLKGRALKIDNARENNGGGGRNGGGGGFRSGGFGRDKYRDRSSGGGGFKKRY